MPGEKNHIILCLKSKPTAVENLEVIDVLLFELQAVLSQHPGIDLFLIYSTESLIAQLTLALPIVDP